MLLDIEMKKSDELLSRMIPRSISEKIAAGTHAVDTCEVFDMVTIVFNDIPAFLDMCAYTRPVRLYHDCEFLQLCHDSVFSLPSNLILKKKITRIVCII